MTEDDTDIDKVGPRDGSEETDTAEALSGEWDEVPPDPDLKLLGYETSQWERVPVTDRDQVIFLPGTEEDLDDNAFVVLEESDLCDLVTRR